MAKLEELKYNGQFAEHERLATSHLDRYRRPETTNPDMVANLLLERAVALHYAKKLRESRKLAKDVLKMESSLINSNLLLGRAYGILGTAYRRKGGKGYRYLEKGVELLSNHESGEETADICYYMGVKLWYFSSISSEDRTKMETFKRKAKEYLKMSIKYFAEDERPRMFSINRGFVTIRLAATYLECGSPLARLNRGGVKSENIREAKGLLDVVEYQMRGAMPVGAEIQLLKTRADQYYCEGRCQVATEAAKEALRLARRVNMELEIKPLKERIEEYRQLIGPEYPRWRGLSGIYIPTDSGNSADESSND